MNVYFIPGMCANCGIFERISLPEGFEKKYLEWHIPTGQESIEEYARKMAQGIDTESPFVLLGYSFGGILVQEMNRFLSPEKTIVMASIKQEEEKPPLFRLGRKIGIAETIPTSLFKTNKLVKDTFTRMVYKSKPEDMDKYVTCTDPVYIKWCVARILEWKPVSDCKCLYHVHGTHDQMFPYKYVKTHYTVENGDHLMVRKKYREINKILSEILRM